MESSAGPSIDSRMFMPNQHDNNENIDHSGNEDSEVGEREVGLDNVMEDVDGEDHSASQVSDESDDEDSNINNSSLSTKFKSIKAFKSHIDPGQSSVISSSAYDKYNNTSHSISHDRYPQLSKYSNQTGAKLNGNAGAGIDSDIQTNPSEDYYQQFISKQTSVSKSSESGHPVKFSSQFQSNVHSKSDSATDGMVISESKTGLYSDLKSGLYSDSKMLSRDSNHLSYNNSSSDKVSEIPTSQRSNTYQEQVFSKIPVPYSRQLEHQITPNDESQAKAYQELYKNYCNQNKEMAILQKKFGEASDHSNRELRILQSQVTTLQTDNERLKTYVQQKDSALTSLTKENTTLKGNLMAVEVQAKIEKEAKEEVTKKLECAEVMISSLNMRMAELTRSEDRSRYVEQHKTLVKDLKKRHAEEVLFLQKDVEDLKLKLESKLSKISDMQRQFDDAKQDYRTLAAEKSEVINQLNAGLEACQNQGLPNNAVTIELTRLKQKIKDLETNKRDLEKQNCYLRKIGDTVKSEIGRRHSIESLKIRLESLDEEWRSQKHEEPPFMRRSVENVEGEMQRTLQVLAAQKAMNERLSNQLKVVQEERDDFLARSKFFERKLTEENKKYLDSEDKRLLAIPAGTIPISQHDKEIQTLQIAKTEVENQLKDVQIRLKEVSENEAYLNELTRNLRTDMTTLVKQHDEDKKNAVDVCVKVHAEEKEKLCKGYGKEMSLLKKVIKQLKEEIAVQKRKSDEKQIPREIRDAVKDVTHDKEGQQSESGDNKVDIEARLLKELEIEKEKWETENQEQVAQFIIEMKQKLVAEYDDYLAEEKKKILQQAEEDKQQIIQNYKQNLDKRNTEQNKRLSQNEEMQKIIHFYEVKCKETKEAAVEEVDAAHRKEVETINQTFATTVAKMREEFEFKCGEQLEMISKYRDLYKQEVEASSTKLSEMKETLSAKYQSLQHMAESEMSELKEKIQKLADEKESLAKELKMIMDAASSEKQRHDESANNLKNAFRSANETIAQLQSKKDKYATHSAKLKVEIDEMKEKLKVREKEFSEKEERCGELRKKIEQFHQREQFYQLKLLPKNISFAICQTEEEMVPKKVISVMKDKCLSTIHRMANELIMQKKRSETRISGSLQHCMKAYQDLLYSAVSGKKNEELDKTLKEIEEQVHKLLETYPTSPQLFEMSQTGVSVNEEPERLVEGLKSANDRTDSQRNVIVGSLGSRTVNDKSTSEKKKSRLKHTLPPMNQLSSNPPSNQLSYDPSSTEPKNISHSVRSKNLNSNRRNQDFHSKKGIETLLVSSTSSRSSTPEPLPNPSQRPNRSHSVEAASRSAQQTLPQMKQNTKQLASTMPNQMVTKHNTKSKPSKKRSHNKSPLSPKEPLSNPEDTQGSTVYKQPNSPFNDLTDSLYQFINQLRQMDQFKF